MNLRHAEILENQFFCVQHFWPFIPQQSVNMGFSAAELSTLGLK